MYYKSLGIKKLSDLYIFEAKYSELFPKDKWSDENWENWVKTLDDNSLPIGAKKQDLLDSWPDAAKKLGVATDMKGIKKFIDQVESGKYKYDTKEKEEYDKIKAAVQEEIPEEYDDPTSKDDENAYHLALARKLGGKSKYLGKAIKVIAQRLKSGLGGNMFESLAPFITGMDTTVPVHYQVLFAFITLRDKNLDIKEGTARRVMQEVCEVAWHRSGKPDGEFTVTYADYQKAPGNKGRPTYMYDMSIKDANKDNMYAQLSGAFGNCTAIRQKDGTYKVNDQYDFNVYRGKKARAGDVEARIQDFKEAIPTLANSNKAFKSFWEYLTGDKDGKNAAEYLEPLLLQIQTQFDYKGVPTSITTLKPKDRTKYEKLKNKIKGLFGREEGETLIPGINIPLLESKEDNKKLRLTKKELNEIIKFYLNDM